MQDIDSTGELTQRSLRLNNQMKDLKIQEIKNEKNKYTSCICDNGFFADEKKESCLSLPKHSHLNTKEENTMNLFSVQPVFECDSGYRLSYDKKYCEGDCYMLQGSI